MQSKIQNLKSKIRRVRATLETQFKNPPPYVRAVFVIALVLAIVAVLAFALFKLGAGIELRALEQNRGDKVTSELTASSVAQSFVSPRNNLSSIQVELGAKTDLPQDGRVGVLSGDGIGGPIVYEASLATASWATNPYLTISFPPIANSADMTYTLVLETSGKPLSSAIGVKYSSQDTLTAGTMYLGGEATSGDLTMVVHYRYDMATLLSDVADALTGQFALVVAWLALLWLPGLALLLWLPNDLSAGQRVLAAPALSVLAFPVFLLVTRSLGLRLGTITMWLLILICAVAIGFWLAQNKSKVQSPKSKVQDIAFWALLLCVFFITLAGRLLSLRDALAGMGLDAYHHTLIAEMFVQNGGVPQNYLPYAPLASFTYHFGFHAMTAGVGWLSGHTASTDMLTLMPQAGQIATALPVLTLTLFSWRILNNRWAGLFAGALAGMISIFPAFYVNWSRYTQGLGLALLPVAWVLLIEALNQPVVVGAGPRARPQSPTPNLQPPTPSWEIVARRSGPLMLAVISAAGLALTHYRITMIYAGFAVLYLGWLIFSTLRTPHSALRTRLRSLWRALLVALLTLAAGLPWLLNLRENFGSRFVGKDSPVASGYYSLQNMIGDSLLNHYSFPLLYALSLGGLVLAYRRRDLLPVLPALAWLLLGVWSNPYLFDPITRFLGLSPLRLPYAGYLDATTLATGVWLPLSILAGYALANLGGWLLSWSDGYAATRGKRAVRAATVFAVGFTLLLLGAASTLALSPINDNKPYIAQADLDAMQWMRENLPTNAYVLANPFAFPWDSPPQAVQGSDAGLWIPLLAGIQSSVPPIPSYNERLLDPEYINKVRSIIGGEPFDGTEGDWDALKAALPPALNPNKPPKPGVTHIYVGSRGGALTANSLLKDKHVKPVFHEDAVWVFEVR